MSETNSKTQSSGSQPSSGKPESKLKMLVKIANGESFNELDVHYVADQLSDYESLWSKAVLVDDTLYIKPTEQNEKLAMLLAKSLKADEVDLMQASEWIEHLQASMREYKTANYKKDIQAIESLGNGKFIRVWWD